MDIIAITGSFIVSLGIGISAARGLLSWMFPRSRPFQTGPETSPAIESDKPIG